MTLGIKKNRSVIKPNIFAEKCLYCDQFCSPFPTRNGFRTLNLSIYRYAFWTPSAIEIQNNAVDISSHADAHKL